jgi:hypothetical protein
VIDETGTFIQQRGISPAPGLTFIGRSWQWSRGSAILTGVGDDAAYVALSIVETLASSEDAVMHVAPRVPVRPDAGLRLRADAVDA